MYEYIIRNGTKGGQLSNVNIDQTLTQCFFTFHHGEFDSFKMSWYLSREHNILKF